MFGAARSGSPQQIEFVLLPQFSMIAFTASIEPLRAANRLAGRTLYRWRTFSVDGTPVTASNEVSITPDGGYEAISKCDALFVCAGLRPQTAAPPILKQHLRRLALRGVPLGAVCTGSMALAKAGVLSGHRCTIHWEDLETFKEMYPALNITPALFEIDRNRYTCSGGTAPLDMMIYSIKLDHGETLALNVAEQMLLNFVREPEDNQRMAIEHRTGITHPKLLAAIGHMEAYLEMPLALPRLAKMVGLSVRQLERLFKTHIGRPPGTYYRELRLRRARQFLRRTSMTVLEIAMAAGFNSPSHFSKAYKDQFGYSPQAERS